MQSPVKKTVIYAIDLYRHALSPFMPGLCRFAPSCSVYSKEAIEKHGLVKGSGLALKRLSKCHPFHPGGYDPVK